MPSFERKPLTLGATRRMESAQMWKDIKKQITDHLEQGNIEGIAHTLACSWWGASEDMGYSKSDYAFNKEKARTMCTDPRLIPYREQLWRMIVAENEYDGKSWDFKDEAYRIFTEEYDWDI